MAFPVDFGICILICGQKLMPLRRKHLPCQNGIIGYGAGWRPMSQTLPVESFGGVRLRSTFDSALGTREKENRLRRVSGEGTWQCALDQLSNGKSSRTLQGGGNCSSGEGAGAKIDQPTDTRQCGDESPYRCFGIAIAELGTTWRWKGRLAAIGRKWYFSRTRDLQ